jgi:phosphatidylglycerophosphatase B
VKSWVKDRVQEPRPFVVWLEKTHHVPVDEFYNLKRKDRGALVKEQLAEQQDIPKFLRKHWQKRPGSRFLPATRCLRPAGRCWRWAALAATSNGHHRDFAGLGDGSDGQPLAAGDALATGSGRRHADLMAAGDAGDLACERLCGPLTPPPKRRRNRRKGPKRRLTVDIRILPINP